MSCALSCQSPLLFALASTDVFLVPLGRAAGDGLHFQANPRFGPNGEWLQKKDWPKELQRRYEWLMEGTYTGIAIVVSMH